MNFVPPLILGGHSFISQLGTDPRPSESQIDALVSACLDRGIRHFDTTYRPERIALGASLKRLGRRDEARIIAWNLFQMFDDGGECGGAEEWNAARLTEVTADLQSERVEELVLHCVGDEKEQWEQETLAREWKAAGRIERLGLWAPATDLPDFASRAGFDFAVEPCNLFTPYAAERLALYARHGLETYATSPFVRGWQLEKLVGIAQKQGLEAGKARTQIADHLLRFSLFHPHVTHLIVSMRRAQWIAPNLESARRGPLEAGELAWLEELKTASLTKLKS